MGAEGQDMLKLRIAFHETRIIGEKLLRDHIISWGAFSLFMIAFEEKLRSLDEDL